MKSYKSFERRHIGTSDIASLTLRSVCKVGMLDFGEDRGYNAYICVGDDVEIGSHYSLEFSGQTWLIVYDDEGIGYKDRHEGMVVDVYRAGMMGCIIHWHH